MMKIALSGKMRAGKDFIADKIMKKYPKVKRVAFADELKAMVKENFGIDKDHPKGREALQMYGAIGRMADPLFWVKKAVKDDEHNVVITDLRFKNEAQYLIEHGFFLVRIEASEETRAGRGELKNQNDISETDLDCYDVFQCTLDNNKDSKEYKKLLKLIGA